MYITTPTDITDILWAGPLEPPAVTKSVDGSVYASLGKPAQWPDSQLLGDQWRPPVGGNRYYLIRLAFSLRPGNRTQIDTAVFCLRLAPVAGGQAVVFDAFPREQLADSPRPLKLAISPSLKLDAAEVSVGGVETTIDFGHATPVIRSDGLAEPTFCWRYMSHLKHPLTGSRSMYAVVEVPPGLTTVEATLDLVVEATNRFGPFRLGAPPAERRRLTWVIGAA